MQEQLELIIYAIGKKLDEHCRFDPCAFNVDGFDPKNDDGDAFRLALILEIDVYQGGATHDLTEGITWVDYEINGDVFGATRSAIFQVAAEVGRRLRDDS